MLNGREHYEQVLSRRGELEEELGRAQRTPKPRRESESRGVVYTYGGHGHHVSVEAQLTTYARPLLIDN